MLSTNAIHVQEVRPDTGPLIVLRDVSKVYRTAGGTFTAVDRVTLEIAGGRMTAIVGKSGSGKSTLVNLVAGLDRPSGGTVQVADTAIGALDESRLAIWRGRTVGVVFQFFQLLPTLTVAENVMLPMDLCGTYRAEPARRRAMELLARVGVAEQADKFPPALSGGQQQRAAIARALANDPPIVIADEPTGNLDSGTAADVLGLFRDLANAGKTVVIVTHERDAHHLFDRVVTISDGRIRTASESEVPDA